MSEEMKNGVIVTMPSMDKSARLNMERFAEFMARMIQKYGSEVLADIEEDRRAQTNQG